MLCLSTSECHGEKRINVQRMRKQMTGTMQAGGQYGGPPPPPPHFLSPSDTALADRIEHVGVSEGKLKQCRHRIACVSRRRNETWQCHIVTDEWRRERGREGRHLDCFRIRSGIQQEK